MLELDLIRLKGVYKRKKEESGEKLKGTYHRLLPCPKSFADTSPVLAATSGIFYHRLVHRGPERRLSATKMS